MDATTEDDQERRWVEAEALLSGASDDSVHRGIRRRRARTPLILLGAWLAVAAFGAGIGWILTEGKESQATDLFVASEPRLWVQILGSTCSVVGLLVIVFGIVQLVRSGQGAARWRAPASVLTTSQKRELYRQVVGKDALQPGRLALARDAARRTTQLRQLLVMLYGSWILFLGSAVTSPSPVMFVLAGATIVLTGTGFILIRRDIGRAERFLKQHPDPDSP